MIAKGQKISDRYQILKSIGEGGMANVYLAYDTILERNVAVKILRGDLATDEKFVRRFQREALQASSLNNQNIVEVYDVGEDHGEYYIVMEYIEGKQLKTLLKKRGKLTVPEVVDIMLQVTSGLSVAHDSYIIHRDIKPQNIMILENGLVKLTDFGIAVAMNSTQLTQTNSVMGSVHYLPPEQACGKGATLQSDIYSLGILMFELLTGKLPYRGDNAVEIALKHLKEPLPSIRSILPDLPQSIENIIMKATAKNPKNRYTDAREMHEDLKTCLDEARINEIKYTFKYPENDYDDNAVLKIKKEANINNKETNKKDGEEVIAKKITENDLKKQNKTIIILMAVFTALVVGITVVLLWIRYGNSIGTIEVPDVTNMTLVDAVKKLEKEGFSVADETLEKNSSTIDEGRVVMTSPSGGSKKKKGSEITIYISKGTAEIVIEDYTGKNCDNIEGALDAQGVNASCKERDIAEGSEDDFKENTIIDQSVAAGESLKSGDEIILWIPKVQDLYPDFTDGYEILDILDFCEEYELSCKFVDKDKNSLSINKGNAEDYASYKITNQSRKEGAKVTRSATLTITIEGNTSNSEGNHELD